MSKRPRVSLASIVAETARRAGEASNDPARPDAHSIDEGAPLLDLPPAKIAAPAAIELPAPAEAAAVVAAGPALDILAAPQTPGPIVEIPPSAAPDEAPGAAVVSLPAILDLKAAAKLRDAFVAAKGGSLRVDASKVQRLGGLCLQVLLSAQRTWAVDGAAFRVVDPSPDFLDGLQAFGAAALAESAQTL